MPLQSPPTLPYPLDDAQPWTTATDVEYFSTTDEFKIFHSREHDVLFLDPLPKDRLHEIYPSTYYSFSDPSTSLVQRVKGWLDRRLFRTLLKDVHGEQLNVLDVGGGAGWMLNAVRASDPRVTHTQLVDLDPAPGELARAQGHEYFCGRIEDFRSERRYDFILLLNLIEHVENPLAVLESINQLLAPGGRVLVKTPNWDSLDARIFRHSSWAGYHCPRHWVLFTQGSFERLAGLAKLKVIDFKYTQGAPFWAASVLNYLRSRGLCRVDRERPVVQHPSFGLLNAAFAAFDFMRMPFAKTSQMFFVLGKQN